MAAIIPGAWVRLEDPNYPTGSKVGQFVSGAHSEGVYTTSTIRLEDGTLYRNEGRVYLLADTELLITITEDPRNPFHVRPLVTA